MAQAPLSDAWRWLAARGEPRRFARGALLIQEGDRGDTIYLILSGRLRAFSVNEATGREFTYGVYAAGEYVGEMGLDGGLRAATVQALDPSVCVAIARPTLEAFIGEHPAFAFELLAKVIRRARAATLSARQMALNDVYGRLRLALDALAGQPDAAGARRIAPAPTHRELSERLGCTREMVSRLMRDLQRGGYVQPADDAPGAPAGWRLPGPLPAKW